MRITDLSDLGKAFGNLQEKQFLKTIQEKKWSNARKILDDYSIHEIRQHFPAHQVADTYYHAFKEALYNLDKERALSEINLALEFAPHEDLFQRRRHDLSHQQETDNLLTDRIQSVLQSALRDPPSFQNVQSFHAMGTYKYTHDYGSTIHEWSNRIRDFKNGDAEVSRLMGRLLGQWILKETELIRSVDFVVPIPSDPKRSQKRGVDILHELSVACAETLGLPHFPKLLTRSPSEHARNSSKSDLFQAYPEVHKQVKVIQGRTALLIDDICTSGRTLDICALRLKDMGVAAVHTAVLARSESTYRRDQATDALTPQDRIDLIASFYHLMGTKLIGPTKIRDLITKFNTPAQVFEQDEETLKEVKGIGAKLVANITEQAGSNVDYHEFAFDQCNQALARGATIMTILDDGYPAKLKRSKYPVPLIYLKGEREILVKTAYSIAVVGARDITNESRDFIRNLMVQMVEQNWVIVSGGAIGVDETAHDACLAHNGKTVAVFGNGLDRLYPDENRDLFHRIGRDGLLASEYWFGVRVSDDRLRRRNRLIAALSDAILVVQAGEKSGSIMAANSAIEMDRPVFTWQDPQHKGNPAFAGNQMLVEKGKATPVSPGSAVKSLKQILGSTHND